MSPAHIERMKALMREAVAEELRQTLAAVNGMGPREPISSVAMIIRERIERIEGKEGV